MPWLPPAKLWYQPRFPENKIPPCRSLPLRTAAAFGAEEKPLGSSGWAAKFAVQLWLSMGWSGKESAGQAQRSSPCLYPSRCPGSFFLSSFWINNNGIRRFKHSPVIFTRTYGSQSFHKILLVNGSSPYKDGGNLVMISMVVACLSVTSQRKKSDGEKQNRRRGTYPFLPSNGVRWKCDCAERSFISGRHICRQLKQPGEPRPPFP